MNNHLKLLIYIGTIVGIFLLVQEKFNLFDVKLIDKDGKSERLMDSILGEESSGESNEQEGNDYVEIYIPNGLKIKVMVEVADSEEERSEGLSSRRYLGDYDGMLFIFDGNVNHPFWMKDMFLSLDIMFIDAQGFIVDIKSDQQPCDEVYCSQIYSRDSYRYVLEVNSGFCEENEIEVGYSVVQYLQ